jgi:hypothetical protein
MQSYTRQLWPACTRLRQGAGEGVGECTLPQGLLLPYAVAHLAAASYSITQKHCLIYDAGEPGDGCRAPGWGPGSAA